MATAPATIEQCDVPDHQRFLLHNVEWRAYRLFSEALAGHHVRLTYDRGNLEFMTISSLHGKLSRLLGRFVFVLAEEFNLPIRSFGDMTCAREDLLRAVEPDECFYLINEPKIRDKSEIDLDIDPPPDLVVDVDITRSSRNRLGIYAALGVPEAWQFDGEALRLHQRTPQGAYSRTSTSIYFPGLPLEEIAGFLKKRTEMDEVALVRSFREWV